MKKLFNALILSTINITTAFAISINISNQHYPLKYLDTFAKGCNNDFGTTLQQDIKMSPINTLISVNYDIEAYWGYAHILATFAKGVTITEELNPLGILDIYAFGKWYSPQIAIVINNHNYLIYSMYFSTYGDNYKEWINNGNAMISFINPSNFNNVCALYTRPSR